MALYDESGVTVCNRAERVMKGGGQFKTIDNDTGEVKKRGRKPKLKSFQQEDSGSIFLYTKEQSDAQLDVRLKEINGDIYDCGGFSVILYFKELDEKLNHALFCLDFVSDNTEMYQDILNRCLLEKSEINKICCEAVFREVFKAYYSVNVSKGSEYMVGIQVNYPCL